MGKLVSTLSPAKRTEGTVTTPLSSHSTTWLCLCQTWLPRHTCPLPPGWPRTGPYRHLSVRVLIRSPPLRTEGRREDSSRLLPLISPPPSPHAGAHSSSATHSGPSMPPPPASSYGCLSKSLGPSCLSCPSPRRSLPSWALLLSLQLVSSLNTDAGLLFHFRNHREKGHRIEILGENAGGRAEALRSPAHLAPTSAALRQQPSPQGIWSAVGSREASPSLGAQASSRAK